MYAINFEQNEIRLVRGRDQVPMKQSFVIDLDQSSIPFWLGQLVKECLRHGWEPVCGCISRVWPGS